MVPAGNKAKCLLSVNHNSFNSFTLTPGSQFGFSVFVVVTNYSDEVQTTATTTKNKHSSGMKVAPKRDKLHSSDLQYIYICIYASHIYASVN